MNNRLVSKPKRVPSKAPSKIRKPVEEKSNDKTKSNEKTKSNDKTSTSADEGQNKNKKFNTHNKELKEKTSRLEPSSLDEDSKKEKDKKVTSKPLYVAASGFINQAMTMGVLGIASEFDQNFKHSASHQNITAFQANPIKNKSRNIVCLEDTRVVLTVNVPPNSDYIHANAIKVDGFNREFFVTQSPMESTISDFWRLVYQTEAASVVMLGPFEEEGHKCPQYFPEKFCNYKDMFVNTKRTFIENNLTCHTIEVLPDGCSNSIITKLILFNDWPDHSFPRKPLRILRLLKSIPPGPCVLHSTTGAGRPGTLIAIEIAVHRFVKMEQKPNIKEIVQTLRTQRAHSVETNGQYCFIYYCISQYMGRKMMGQIKKMASKFNYTCKTSTFLNASLNNS